MSALDTLTRLCPPPASAPDVFDWDTIEARLALRLPDDYKRFVTLYGRGGFNDFLTVYLPDGGHEEYALTGPTTARNQELITRAQLAGPGRWDLPCEVERLVTMGETGNGDYLFWMTDPADIRTWARAHGYDVPDRGRIPVDILQAYEQAHSTTT